MTHPPDDTPPDSVPPQQRGLKRGNKGNKGGRSYPKTYKEWLKTLLDSEKHRKEFMRQMEDGEAPNFKFATEHAAAHAYGKPKETVKADTTLTVRIVNE